MGVKSKEMHGAISPCDKRASVEMIVMRLKVHNRKLSCIGSTYYVINNTMSRGYRYSA